MHLDPTRAITRGLVAAALFTVGLVGGCERAPSSRTGASKSPVGAPACVTKVAERAACALPPRGAMEQGARPDLR